MTRDMINTELFWAKVDGLATDGCWHWQAYRTPKGYGGFGVGKRCKAAHRISFFLATGLEPEMVCHACDNPSCVNPSHLFAGNARANTDDMMRKGRSAHQTGRWIAFTGERARNSKLTEMQVLAIRKGHDEGQTNKYLADLFDVDASTIAQIVRRKTWRHL